VTLTTEIRLAEKWEYAEVRKHYELCGYRGGANDNDVVIIAIENKDIIGAVRICHQNGEKVLRGMYIRSPFRNKGIGKAILQFLHEKMDLHNCYCLPYSHLRDFYGMIGFEEIKTANAPVFLSERLANYMLSGVTPIIIMKHH
jgi:GNAT superfamily N-acetyltransferase